MPKDPIIAIRDCLREIAILQEIAGRMTLQGFRNDPIARRAAAYAIQTISEAVRRIPDEWLADFAAQPWAQIRASAIDCAMNTSGSNDAILWEVLTIDAPSLQLVMQSMLDRHGGNAG